MCDRDRWKRTVPYHPTGRKQTSPSLNTVRCECGLFESAVTTGGDAGAPGTVMGIEEDEVGAESPGTERGMGRPSSEVDVPTSAHERVLRQPRVPQRGAATSVARARENHDAPLTCLPNSVRISFPPPSTNSLATSAPSCSQSRTECTRRASVQNTALVPLSDVIVPVRVSVAWCVSDADDGHDGCKPGRWVQLCSAGRGKRSFFARRGESGAAGSVLPVMGQTAAGLTAG